jgi:uncharacterized phage protein gp47/JayE
MSYTVPSTAEIVERNIQNIESRLNQKTPAADLAYNRVIATQEGMAQKGLYEFAADRIKANFALTAIGDDLDAIGNEYDVTRTAAKATELTVTIPAGAGTSLPVNTVFTGNNGLKYETQETASASDGVITPHLICDTLGTSGIMSVGDTLTIESPVADIDSTATVTVVRVLGTAEQTDSAYRSDILNAERTDAGGGNSADYRLWGEAVDNVEKVYPFTGITTGTSKPGDRTVYVEATESYEADGIADSTLLAAVRSALLNDPDTGEARQLLGLVDDQLFVESIIRTGIYITISNMSITTGTEVIAQSDVTSALTTLLKQFHPFVQGLDADFDRMDSITGSQLAREVQSVLDSYGGVCENVLFGTSLGTYLGKYDLGNNELVKIISVTFA